MERRSGNGEVLPLVSLKVVTGGSLRRCRALGCDSPSIELAFSFWFLVCKSKTFALRVDELRHRTLQGSEACLDPGSERLD